MAKQEANFFLIVLKSKDTDVLWKMLTAGDLLFKKMASPEIQDKMASALVH